MLEIKNINMTYTVFPVLTDVSFSVGSGEIIGLFGENGAGKTTILKLILRLIKEKSGEILLDGHKITYKDMTHFAFATSEHSHFPMLTANEHAEFFASQFPAFNKARYKLLMDFFKLPPNRKLKQLSLGQKNQIETVLALSQGADYILLDEPFASNDIFNREDFYKMVLGLLEPDETIIISTHLIDEVENFISRAILLKDKKIIADLSSDTIAEKGMSLKDYISDIYHHSSEKVYDYLNSHK